MKLIILLSVICWTLITCTMKISEKATTGVSSITAGEWGEVDGRKVYLYTLANARGTKLKITNYGGIVTEWSCVDKYGKMSSVVLGYSSLEPYLTGNPYFGVIAGRFANRIGGARFSIDGNVYTLAQNDNKNSLHGGSRGFDKQVWEGKVTDDDEPLVELTYLSRDGEEGFPGNLQVKVVYTLTADNELRIDYAATTDKPTVVNLTNHSYFNLTGSPANTVLDHLISIKASLYTPVDAFLIPTGELAPVAGTIYDLQEPVKIGQADNSRGSYDHNFVLNGEAGTLREVAVVTDSLSGRELHVATTQPGMQFYSGHFLDGSIKSSDGIPYRQYTGFCLETQHFPDSPNKPHFPSTLLRPGETYRETTIYKVNLIGED